MHIIQMAFALLASGASVLIVTALVLESLHDKKSSQAFSIDLHDQLAGAAPAQEHPANSAPAAQPLTPQPDPPKSIETEVVVPASRNRNRRQKKERTADGEEKRKGRREAKRQESGERHRRRGRDADSGLSAEAQEG